MKYLNSTTKKAFQKLFEEDHLKAVGMIKDDWYGLDQLYNRIHPGGLFWQVIHKTPYPPSYLPFIKEKALYQQYDHIRKFYGDPTPEWFVQRPYPYLNENTMTRVVDDTVQATLIILEKIKYTSIENLQSSVEVLPSHMTIPYHMPL